MKNMPADLKERVAELYLSGKSSGDVSSELHISVGTVSKIIRELGIARSKLETKELKMREKKEKAIELYKSGLSTYDVAKEIGVHHSSVGQWVTELGINRDRSAGAVTRHKNHPMLGEDHPHYGKPRPAEVRKKISDTKEGKILVKCSWCETEFEIHPSRDIWENHYCKPECEAAFKKLSNAGEGNPNWQGKLTKVNCAFCGEELIRPLWQLKRYEIFFCDNGCSGAFKSEHISGENNPNWCGGISFGPYCKKWTEQLRERVRIFFDRKCALCGAEEDPDGPRLAVHHVDYDKTQCCNGKKPYLVPLCPSCHNKTSGKHVRSKYEAELKDLIDTKYSGRCYLTKEEYKQLR